MAQMFGWLSAASIRASRSKRASRSGSLVKARRQRFDRDVARERRVVSPVHLAHAARTEQRLQMIWAKGSTGQSRRRRGGDHMVRHDEHGCGKEPIVGSRLVQQRFDVAPQLLVPSTGLGEKGRTLPGVARARLVIQLLSQLPAFRRHSTCSSRASVARG